MVRQSFTELSPYLWVTQSEVFATNSGIFISEGTACLIDPGITAEEVAGIARFTKDLDAIPRMVILTHGHWDHLLGAAHFPKARIIAHGHYADTLLSRGAEIQRQIAQWEAEYNIQREHPFILPEPTQTFDNTVTLPIGREALKLSYAPGHAADELVIYHTVSAMLWAGDMLSDIEIPFTIHNLTAYEETLANLATLDIQILIPGHGNPTRNADEIRTRLAEDRTYLAEIRWRVTQAIEAGRSMEETVALCADISHRCMEDNTIPHQRNVESAYVELGGEAPARYGWAH